MTNEQILKKAMEKAHSKGWLKDLGCEGVIEWITSKEEQYGTLLHSQGVETILFSHDFAKAFWGEEETCSLCGTKIPLDKIDCPLCYAFRHVDSWQYHLQTMVLEEDPIKYLARFL